VLLCRWMQAQHAPTAAAAEDMPEPVEQMGPNKVAIPSEEPQQLCANV
jgi:hypothetical protein